MRLIKTDHNEQSLVMDKTTKSFIVESLTLVSQSTELPLKSKQQASDFIEFLLDTDNYDSPTLSHRYREIANCPSCNGTGKIKHMPDDRDDEVRFERCETCMGIGQLYFIILKKGYAPTEQIRKQMAK